MKAKPLIILGLTLLLIVGLLILAGEIAVRVQSAQPTQRPDDFVTVLADERVFTLFAMLNAVGYDDENFGEPFHPVRVTVRDYLAAQTLPNLARLRAQLNFTHSYAFVEWALHYGQPPEWPRTVAGWHSSAPAIFFFGLEDELREFYRATDLGALWQRVQPDYEAEAERYRAATGPAIDDVFAYTRMEPSALRRIVVIPNLLDAHWRGYGPHVGETAFIVVGPTGDEPDVGLVQHEALHSLVGPLVEANGNAVASAQADRLFNRLRSEVDTHSYGIWPAILEESVINALGVRLAKPEWRETALHNDEARGFWLTRPLAEKLADYELSEKTLAEFMPEWLASLNQLDVEQLVPERVPAAP